MQIAVLSDLHLGKKDDLDQFHRNQGAEEQLYQLLNYLEKSVDKIVLLGDIFETLRGKTVTKKGKVKELLAALESYPEITNKIQNDDRYIYVHGNHDLIAKDVMNAPKEWKVEVDGVRMVFFHGHHLDPFTHPFAWTRWLSEVGVWAGGMLERTGMDITRKWNIRSKFKALNDQWPISKFELAATKVAKFMNTDIVVTGHSHHPMKFEKDDVLFMNSGARVCGRQDMLILDTTSKEFDLYKKFNPSSQNEL